MNILSTGLNVHLSTEDKQSQEYIYLVNGTIQNCEPVLSGKTFTGLYFTHYTISHSVFSMMSVLVLLLKRSAWNVVHKSTHYSTPDYDILQRWQGMFLV